MQVQLTPDQERFARLAVETGRFSKQEDAVLEAMALWEQRERSRAELLASLDDAEVGMIGGKGRIITEGSMRALAEEVSQRGRARLASLDDSE